MRPLSRSAMKMVRDGFGKFEDKFFSSVFIGSGLVFLAMMFVSSAVGAGLVASSPVIDATNGSAVATFGRMMLLALFPGGLRPLLRARSGLLGKGEPQLPWDGREPGVRRSLVVTSPGDRATPPAGIDPGDPAGRVRVRPLRYRFGGAKGTRTPDPHTARVKQVVLGGGPQRLVHVDTCTLAARFGAHASRAYLRVIGCLRTPLGHAEQVFLSPPSSLYTHRTRCTPAKGLVRRRTSCGSTRTGPDPARALLG